MPRTAAASLSAVALLLAACAALNPTSAASPNDARGPAAAVRIAAAGDIACKPGYDVTADTCQHKATAALIKRRGAAAVLPLGDIQYEVGALSAYQKVYARAWGVFRPKIYPVPGNHEYHTHKAAGYFGYFGARAHGPRGYYAYNLGGWRLYALNSNCTKIDCAAQARWLRKDLAAKPHRCVLGYMHHPRYSSGTHGSSTSVTRLWKPLFKRKAEVVLSGHDHGYERFGRMNPYGGVVSAGIRSFVVGTGGKSLYDFGRPENGSRFRYNGSAGVLFMTLRDGSYSWVFKGFRGRTWDSGSGSCS
jgi:3',5'-cyclic AMP phosphodiesterase CpdA